MYLFYGNILELQMIFNQILKKLNEQLITLYMNLTSLEYIKYL